MGNCRHVPTKIEISKIRFERLFSGAAPELARLFGQDDRLQRSALRKAQQLLRIGFHAIGFHIARNDQEDVVGYTTLAVIPRDVGGS